MSVQLDGSEAAILSRVIQPDAGDWPQAAAEAILRIGFNETDRDHMTALLEKAKAGDLTDDESEVLENYRHIGKLLELMKSRARRSLEVTL
jgi:Ran GTPase-activating protein (RanGAP) involved in mRNA processing and transport